MLRLEVIVDIDVCAPFVGMVKTFSKNLRLIIERTARQELWEGPALSSGTLSGISGVDEVRNLEELDNDLEKIGSTLASFDTSHFTKGDSVFEVSSLQ